MAENLDIILAGQIPPNPIELISSGKTDLLFQELRKMYDYIIVDTPPYGVLTDAFILMNHIKSRNKNKYIQCYKEGFILCKLILIRRKKVHYLSCY